ncbi:hypothetical protein ACJMK2_042449 [Sinanodonta woodiana]|uniref:FAS1 domain-containing protein n=1 Tax=Sinanodonta woodiana TaxID=1069815 RepID=A0ABD3WB69_SINWO
MAKQTFVIVLAVLVMELIVVEGGIIRRIQRMTLSRAMDLYLQRIRTKEPYLFDKLFDFGAVGKRYGFNEKRFFDGAVDPHKPWFQGPNVCYSRTEDPKSESQNKTDRMFHIRRCDGSNTAYKCVSWTQVNKSGQTLTEINECCPGFSRKAVDFGCPIAKKLQDFISTARELNLNELIRAIEEVDLVPMLTEANNSFTIFGPTDEAFQKIKSLPLRKNGVPSQANSSVVIVSKQPTDSLQQDTRKLILGHFALVKLTSPHLKNNQLIETASPFKSKIRVNLYDSPKHIMTADCKRIMTVDSVALNGVIHVVEEILQPVTDSLMDKISRHPDLSYLKTVFDQTDLGQMLREDGDFTVFAPTDSAFRRMDPIHLNKLLSRPTCLSKFVKSHVLPSVVCSSVLQRLVRTKSILGNNIKLLMDASNSLHVNGAQVMSKDNMATNGVLYTIDDVLLMDDAKTFMIVAQKSGFTKFLDLIDAAGLRKNVDNLENVTIFVPSNKALDEATLSDLGNNSDKLQAVLKYHIARSEVNLMGLYDNLQLDTLHAEQKIRINKYSLLPSTQWVIRTAQCAKIVKTDIKSCNAIIHVVDKVLIPSSDNVVDVLSKDSRVSTFLNLLRMADLTDTLQEDGPFTVFAPTNSAFNAHGSDAVFELQRNKDRLVKLLKNHIGIGTVCCSGIFYYEVRPDNFKTLSGEVFNLDRIRGYRGSYFKSEELTECDKTGTNGVVHVINRVLMD